MSSAPQESPPNEGLEDVPVMPTKPRLPLRKAFWCIGLAFLLLIIFEGESLRKNGETMDAGWQRNVVLAVGTPTSWISRTTGMHGVKNHLVAWARSGQDLSSVPGGFDSTGVGTGGGTGAGVTGTSGGPQPVSPQEIDPRYVDPSDAPLPKLKNLLITGDSMVQPLDSVLARAFSTVSSPVVVERDARIGTGISKTDILDWGRLSTAQVRKWHPSAVVIFLGANEGFPMDAGERTVDCCGLAWATEYASRARRMMNTYRQNGAARVYWLNLPAPRTAAQQRVSRAVNDAIATAAAPLRDRVRLLDLSAIFTPGGDFRSSMQVAGRPTLVRVADGIHLNEAGSRLAAQAVLSEMRSDYGTTVPR